MSDNTLLLHGGSPSATVFGVAAIAIVELVNNKAAQSIDLLNAGMFVPSISYVLTIAFIIINQMIVNSFQIIECGRDNNCPITNIN